MGKAVSGLLAICATGGALGGFSGFSTQRPTSHASAAHSKAPLTSFDAVAEKAQPSSTTSSSTIPRAFPKLEGAGSVHGLPNSYQLNQGKAIDTLRRDYPRLLTHEPDMSIFTDDVALFDPSGQRLSGLAQYARVFEALRFLRRTTMTGSEVTYRVIVTDQTIRVRWVAKLWMRPMVTLMGVGAEPTLVQLDGVSAYELDDEGFIYMHRLENIVMRGMDQAAPIDLGFVWPRAELAVPELARPFFRSLAAALPADQSLAFEGIPHPSAAHPAVSSASPAPRAGRPTGRRAPQPRASDPDCEVRETPLERAAREQAEMAADAARIKELRTPKPPKKKGFSLGNLMSAPQTCESNYDCERPLVCCDVLVAKVCCDSGMMVGMPARSPQEAMAPVPIPIPVEAEPGRGPPPLPGPQSGGLPW